MNLARSIAACCPGTAELLFGEWHYTWEFLRGHPGVRPSKPVLGLFTGLFPSN